MARPRLSDEEHALRGTRATRAQAPSESVLSPGRPRMPAHLGPEARIEFRRVSKIMGARKSETPGDAGVLALYAVIYSRWVAAKREVEKDGLLVETTVLDSNGMPHSVRRLHPLLKVTETCEKNLLALSERLGLTPAHRDRPKPLKGTLPAPAQPVDELEMMISAPVSPAEGNSDGDRD